MPYLTKRQFEELQRAGNLCANICYNLGHGTQVTDPHILAECASKWDAAKESIRLAWIAKESVARGEAIA